MIGRRAALAGVVAIGVAGSAVGADAQGAAVGVALREARLAKAVETADAALGALESELRAALDAGRRGSARVVAGAEPPGVELEVAADAVAAAGPEATAADVALVAQDGTARAVDGSGGPPSPTTAGELVSIAAQLRATAPAADEFAAMRHRTTAVLEALHQQLNALSRGDPQAAQEHGAAIRELLVALAGWDPGLVTLPIWLDTTRRMADAVERLVEAMLAGDVEGAEQAERAFEAVAPEAREADIALQLALTEGGSAVAAAPLQRLVGTLRRTTEARASLALILHTSPSPAP